jgi:amino acid transporter
MVVAAAAPLSVVAGAFPIGIAAGNGASFPAAYVVCTAVLLVFAVGFTAMSRHVPDAGAFASYIAKGLGRASGTGAAFLAVVHRRPPHAASVSPQLAGGRSKRTPNEYE